MLIDKAMAAGAARGAPEEAPAEERPGLPPARGGNVDEASPGPQSEETNAGGAASNDEQGAYERVVLAGIKLLTDPQSHGAIVEHLKASAERPDEAIADLTAMLVAEIDKKANGQVPKEVILPAAAELLGEVALVAQKSGAFEVTDEVTQNAMQLMVVALMQKYRVQGDEVREYMQGVDVDQVRSSMKPSAPAPAPAPAAAVEE